MPDTRINELLSRLELVAKLGGVLKWLIIAAFGLGGWVAVLQEEVQSSRQTITDIQLDRKERITAADTWRRQKDKEDAERAALISQIVKIQDHQQSQIEALTAHRP